MNKLNNQEEAFRKVLQDMTFEVDTSEVWGDIKDRLPMEKTKERKPFWLYFFGLMGVFFLSSFALYVSMNEAQVMSPNGIAFNQAVTSSSVPHTNLDSITISNTLTSNQKTINSITKIGEFSSNPIVSSHLNQINKSTPAYNQSISSQINKMYEPNKFLQSNSVLLSHNESTNNSPESTGLLHSTQASNISQSLDQMSELRVIEQIIIGNEYFFPIAINFDNSIHPVNEKNHKFGLFINLNSGLNYGFADNSLSNMNSDFNENEFDKESGRVGLSTDFNLGIETRKGWRFFGSLAYDYDVFNYQNNEITTSQTIETDTTSVHINSSGQSIPTTGNVLVNTTTEFDLSHHRRHTDIAIGIGVAKCLRLTHNFSIVPQVKALYNINRVSTGYHFDETSNVISKFEANETSPYSTNQFIKYNAGLGLDYSIGKMSFGLLTSYTYNPNNYLDDTSFYRSTNDRVDLKLSISYYPQW